MNRLFFTSSLITVVLLATLATQGREPKETGYQTAVVVGVDRVTADSNYVGVSPTDAPLMPEAYRYDVTIGLNCNVYTARYESATDYLPAAFAANHKIDVRMTGHAVYVSLASQDREIKMGIVGRKRLKERACPATS